MLAALLFRAEPFLPLHGGQDQGVYVSMSAHLQREGSVFIDDPVPAALPNEQARNIYDSRLSWNRGQSLQPGIYLSRTRGDYVFQFYHLHPLWMATFAEWFGDGARFYSLTFFSLLSIAGIALLLFEMTGSRLAALVVGLLLALNPPARFLQPAARHGNRRAGVLRRRVLLPRAGGPRRPGRRAAGVHRRAWRAVRAVAGSGVLRADHRVPVPAAGPAGVWPGALVDHAAPTGVHPPGHRLRRARGSALRRLGALRPVILAHLFAADLRMAVRGPAGDVLEDDPGARRAGDDCGRGRVAVRDTQRGGATPAGVRRQTGRVARARQSGHIDCCGRVLLPGVCTGIHGPLRVRSALHTVRHRGHGRADLLADGRRRLAAVHLAAARAGGHRRGAPVIAPMAGSAALRISGSLPVRQSGGKCPCHLPALLLRPVPGQ